MCIQYSDAEVLYKLPIPLLSPHLISVLLPRNPFLWPSSTSHTSPSDWARELFKPSKDAADTATSRFDQKKLWSVLYFVFFVGDVTKRVVLVFLGLLYRALDSDPMYEIFDSNFCGNEAKIQVFRALDWLSSTFGSKVMAKKTKFDKNVKTMICLYQANLCPNTTRLPIELERRLTPLKMREVM